jgi:arsenite methyltransferase
MLARARLNASKSNFTNVSFVESPITAIDLPSGSTDCIISNCVINLVPAKDKHLVFEEIFRLLKPGGRVAVSDILAKKEFPPDLQRDMSLYVGCISGASLIVEYEEWLRDAGFIGMFHLEFTLQVLWH